MDECCGERDWNQDGMSEYIGVEGIVHDHRSSGALCPAQRIESLIRDKVSTL